MSSILSLPSVASAPASSAAQPVSGRFAADCGVPSGIVLDIDGEPVAIADGYAILGSAALEEDTVARIVVAGMAPSQVYIQPLDGQFYLFDLTAAKSLVIDGVAANRGVVAAGQSFVVGERTISVRPSGPTSGDASTAADAIELDASGTVYVSSVSGQAAGRRHAASRPVTLMGTASHCGFRLRPPNIEPVHCSLVRTGDAVYVLHLPASGRTLVEGRSILQTRIRGRRKVTIGTRSCFVEFEPADDYDSDDVELARDQPEPSAGTMTVAGTAADLPSEIARLAPGADAGVVRELMLEMADAQRTAMKHAEQMVHSVLEAQERQHTRQLEMMQQQNDQLMEVVRTLAGGAAAATPAVAEPQISVPSVTVNVPSTSPAMPEPALPAEPPQPANKPPAEAPTEVRDAWVRSQLHTISEDLNQSNNRGFRKLIGSLFGDKNDALK